VVAGEEKREIFFSSFSLVSTAHFFATFSPPNRFLISSQKCVVDYLMYIGCLGDEIWSWGGDLGDRGIGGQGDPRRSWIIPVFWGSIEFAGIRQEDVEIGDTERGIRVQKRNEKG